MRRFAGRVAVVTGGGSGIGEAICIRLADEGARVAVLDISHDAAAVTTTLCGGAAFVADVADSGAVDAAFARIEQELGPVDVLVNNAGIAGVANSERIAPQVAAQTREAGEGKVTTGLDALVRMTDEEWRLMFAVHVDGTFHCSRTAVRSMRERGRGSIVNVASVCGLQGCVGHPHYTAAKGAVIALSREMGKELIVQGIRVNAIAPGFVETPLTRELSADQRHALELATPIGRLGTAAEIADAVAFLASEDASFCVGEVLSANGGLLTA